MKFEKFACYRFWFLVGSQDLYGKETLDKVEKHAQILVNSLDQAPALPFPITYAGTMKTSTEIEHIIRLANNDETCAGVIVWMHTFSPSKMWINGLSLLQKPYCHLHTQFNRNIPNTEIDMDFMNLNQSAHGDREHGFIAARMGLPRKIIVGYWEDLDVQQHIGSWMRAAYGALISKQLKIIRFGDNMRNVAVTEGDKVGVQIQLGWQVNTWGVGDLIREMESVSEKEIDLLVQQYQEEYEMATDQIESVRYQAQEEIAIRRFLDRENAMGFTNTFEDLQEMRQLPGLATQHLLSLGYGYGGEGDWKVAAMTALLKTMTADLNNGTGFMEDYTYDLEGGNELSLGAHMLEVCPSFASERPRIEVHPLGIGGKEPPARLLFEGHPGKAVLVSLVDIGGRLRLISQDIEVIKPILPMPNLPVARLMWRAAPNFKEGTQMWILVGGAHHSTLSFDITEEILEDWSELMGIEHLHIGKESSVKELKQQLKISDLIWRIQVR